MFIIHFFRNVYRLFIGSIKKIRRRILLAKVYVKLERAYSYQLKDRLALRKDIRTYLYDFFGVNARSKYIPKNFKNNEEVRVAVESKFGDKMKSLNVNYKDL